MKEICLNILQGLLLFAIGIAIVLCVAGIVYAIAHLSSLGTIYYPRNPDLLHLPTYSWMVHQ